MSEIEERFREKLDEAILDLKEYLSEERLGTMIEKYKTVVKPYLYEMPDVFYAPLTSEQYDELAASTSGRNRKKLSALCRKS